MRKYKNGDIIRTTDGWRFVITDASHQDKGTVVACPEGHMQYPTSIPICDIRKTWTKNMKIFAWVNGIALLIAVFSMFMIGDNPFLWISVILGTIVVASVVNLILLLDTN